MEAIIFISLSYISGKRLKVSDDRDAAMNGKNNDTLEREALILGDDEELGVGLEAYESRKGADNAS
jgi:hypothetical protein